MGHFIFTLLGGTFFVTYGVRKMGQGLEDASLDFLERLLRLFAGNVYTAFFVGVIVTGIVQSSTAVTVLTVGLVNAGVLELTQAVGIIFGANIGTTVTAQIMAFSLGIEITSAAYPVLALGLGMQLLSQKRTTKSLGKAVCGFGLLFLGLKALSFGASFISESPAIFSVCKKYASNPIFAVFLGASGTALIHSSSATVGLVMVLGERSLIDFRSCICMMLGDNIGTCFTAQLAGLKGNLQARRASWSHTLYNVIGVALALLFLQKFMWFTETITGKFRPEAGMAARLADAHAIFNVLSAAAFLPLNRVYVRFIESAVREK